MKIPDFVDDKAISPEDLKNSTPLMPDVKISEAGILNLLKDLIPQKAAGPDRIKPVILQELRVELAPIINVILNAPLSPVLCHLSGTQPMSRLYSRRWKNQLLPNRPISLICILCKVMEHIIASNLVRHLDSNRLMYDLQHGFRERGSCETQLVSLIEDLARRPARENRPNSSF